MKIAMEQSMKIAIVGTRKLTKEQAKIAKAQCDLVVEEATEIITGGARGVDTIAEQSAKEAGKPVTIIRPKNPKNKKDYLIRNMNIVNTADGVVAIWDGNSKGTQFVINYCKKINKNLVIITI